MSAEDDALAARVVELETRLAFQEEALQQLNDALLRQQQLLHRLTNELAALTERLRGIEPSPVGRREDEPPPPHY
jgi:SlyX protein